MFGTQTFGGGNDEPDIEAADNRPTAHQAAETYSRGFLPVTVPIRRAGAVHIHQEATTDLRFCTIIHYLGSIRGSLSYLGDHHQQSSCSTLAEKHLRFGVGNTSAREGLSIRPLMTVLFPGVHTGKILHTENKV